MFDIDYMQARAALEWLRQQCRSGESTVDGKELVDQKARLVQKLLTERIEKRVYTGQR